VAPSSAARSLPSLQPLLRAAGLAGLLLGAVLCAYQPALKGGFLWDDDAHVTRPELRSAAGLWRIWAEVGATQQYYPVLHSAFWVEHRLWGDSVVGYHLANLLFHAAAAWLLVRVLRGLAFPAPWVAGLMFALHPVCVESVAWISEQKNTLSAVFYLGAGLAYLRFDETRKRGPYFTASGLFLLALLTKTVTATLPAALLVVFWWRRGRLGGRRDLVPLLPWFAAAAVGGFLTSWAEVRLIGAEGAEFAFTPAQRLVLCGKAIAFYISKLVWPSDLTFIYPRWTLVPNQASAWAADAAVLLALALLALTARRWRGPLAGLLFFVGTLFPVLGFLNVYPFLFSFVADHFQYLACLGVLVPASWGLVWLGRRTGLPPGLRTALVLAIPAALGVLTWRQCRQYRDAETLYRATLIRNPQAWLAHYNLAITLEGRPERREEAISEYEATVRLHPGHWAARNNLGSAYLKVPGRTAEAIAEFKEAVRLKPDFADAQNNLGVALGRIPKAREEAIAHLRLALRLRPDYDGAHNNLGALLVRDPATRAEAVAEYEKALRLAPDNAEYHYNLGNALSDEPGRLSEAVAQYEAALRLDPSYAEAHANLAAAYARLPGHLADAVTEFEAVTRLKPDLPEAHFYLGVLLLRSGQRRADALAEIREALRLRPDFEAARRVLEQVEGAAN
jgi:tetratricopeptide (TPR) repeat protein